MNTPSLDITTSDVKNIRVLLGRTTTQGIDEARALVVLDAKLAALLPQDEAAPLAATTPEGAKIDEELAQEE